jgi:hypothetical protein
MPSVGIGRRQSWRRLGCGWRPSRRRVCTSRRQSWRGVGCGWWPSRRRVCTSRRQSWRRVGCGWRPSRRRVCTSRRQSWRGVGCGWRSGCVWRLWGQNWTRIRCCRRHNWTRIRCCRRRNRVHSWGQECRAAGGSVCSGWTNDRGEDLVAARRRENGHEWQQGSGNAGDRHRVPPSRRKQFGT